MPVMRNMDLKVLRTLSSILVLLIIAVFPVMTACRSSALVEEELQYGQSAALLKTELKAASELPDIPHYDLRLEINIDEASYNGDAVIDYTNLEEDSLSSIFLRLLPNGGGTYGDGSLEISEVKINGNSPDLLYSLNDSAVELLMNTPLEPGKHAVISFVFQGRIPVDFNGGGYGIFNIKNGIASLAGWYPIIPVYDREGWNIDPVSSIGDSVYSDIAYYTVEFTLPEGIKQAATGVIAQETREEDSVRYKYISGPVRDFFIVMGREFDIKSKNFAGTDINVYYLPGHERAADATLNVTERAFKTFNRYFGNYPYSEFDIIDAQMNGSIAVEFPGIVIVGSQVFGNAVFTSHEISHQWWYNVVGNDVIDDPWLDEALATYSSILYYEFNRSSFEYLQVLDYFIEDYESAVASGDDDAVTEGLDHFEPLGGRHYSRIVYSKGAVFYHELRQEIGDRAFFAALKDYYKDKKYGIASNDDILDRFEEYSGMDLKDFYQEWLY